jgi:type I restriction enzyme S subunit
MTLREAGVKLIDCDHRTPPPAASGYPYVAIPQLKNGRIDLSDVRRITHEHFIEWTQKANPQPDDVILSRRCNPGETAVVPYGFEGALGQNLVLLRADESKVFKPFLRWLVRGPNWWEQIGKFLNVGAVFDSLRCADVPNFELPVPPISEQKSIAEILGALDSKIDLNRRTNETLEKMARTLFTSWFMNFDPVRERAARRAPLGMGADLAALFPTGFQDSELGEIPKGWTIKALYDCAEYLNGLAFKQEDFVDAAVGLPVIKIAEIKNGIASQTKYTAKALPSEYRLADGDLLFTWSGSPETSIDTFIWHGGAGWLNQHIFKITPRSPLGRAFVFLMLKHFKPVFIEIAKNKQTTGLGHVTLKDLKRLTIAIPNDGILDAFEKLVSPLLDRMDVLRQQSNVLAGMRDALLPKLLSGELRINITEKSG